MTRPGDEDIPLDLSGIPTVEVGLAKAAKNDKAFATLAKDSMAHGDEAILLQSHIAFHGVINRAVSLHRGIVCLPSRAPTLTSRSR